MYYPKLKELLWFIKEIIKNLVKIIGLMILVLILSWLYIILFNL